MRGPAQALTGFAIALGTAIVILAVSILPFLTPAWVGFEQDRSNVAGLTGFPPAEVRTVTNAILGDLVLDRGDFNVTRGGTTLLTDAERQHMIDVRGVFAGFALLALLSIAVVGASAWLTRRDGRPAIWRAIRRGSIGLAAGVVIAGAIALVAFDAAFELFHRLFFAVGSYDFDPRASKLVQLFPDQFWSETTIALAGVILVAALAVAWFAGRRFAAGSSAVPARVPEGSQPGSGRPAIERVSR